MDVVPPSVPVVTRTERSVFEIVDHLAGLLDTTCQDFVGVQRVVGENMVMAPLSDQDVQTLQKLDSATQTVEAVSTILKNMLTSDGQSSDRMLDVAALSHGVKLSHIIQVLQNRAEAEPAYRSGEVDMF
ncbi:hypothetical protein [Gluconobacter japonicus]|uniref:Chemotaxis protein n=1 Tax=Gluconobacter japonicus TaxID=376620 RepID=A0ABQ5WIV2_GLUJA|nr:hypothetical protein [Gluconobacter japonicus]KXV29724.1 hypothetical protein AD938_01285 [Gluconobacter japonicus]GBR26710.1 hypothetical protein AA3271_2359 [Gluconobacter japonicus NBRC 3271]GLQ59654.1 hypothetical protein GCM10010937_14570 [Gluconobacter japonicus]